MGERVHRIGAVVERDSQVQRHNQLGDDCGAAGPARAKIEETGRDKAGEQRTAVCQDQPQIALQAPPLERLDERQLAHRHGQRVHRMAPYGRFVRGNLMNPFPAKGIDLY